MSLTDKVGRNDYPVYGNILCYNELPDIQRCLDSMSGITDKIYVVDSFSTDGTWEWLNNVKDVYRLELFQRKFTTFGDQRQFLLDKTPVNSWIICIDADEAFSTTGALYLRNDIIHSIPEAEILEKSKNFVVCVETPYCNLKNSVRERVEYNTYRANQVFFYASNVEWVGESHPNVWIKGNPPSHPANALYRCPSEIAIKHYAFLDPKKMEARRQRKESEPGKSDFDNDFYYKVVHKVIPLEDHLW